MASALVTGEEVLVDPPDPDQPPEPDEPAGDDADESANPDVVPK